MKPWIDQTARGPWPVEMVSVTDFCCIVDHALTERDKGMGPLTERLGLPGSEIARLRDRWLPLTPLPDLSLGAPHKPTDQVAIETLILMRSRAASDDARWLATILARRAMEPRHLWEDLGLASRAALSGLIARHLPGLAAANAQNMRWKKFFYRQICSSAAFSLCLSPCCDECSERDACFAPD